METSGARFGSLKPESLTSVLLVPLSFSLCLLLFKEGLRVVSPDGGQEGALPVPCSLPAAEGEGQSLLERG